MRPIHAHEYPRPPAIIERPHPPAPREPLWRFALSALSIPLCFATVCLGSLAFGVQPPIWFVFGGLLYGGMAVWAVEREWAAGLGEWAAGR